MHIQTTLAALEAAISFMAARLTDRRRVAARAVLSLHDRDALGPGGGWYDCWQRWETADVELATARRRLRLTCPDCLGLSEHHLDANGCDRHRPLLEG